ncbi:MAG: hypothetical protein HY926_04900 [Elusimicrobia bacterium]|nr:hypothetical protein [Elusimicrobiota bacterium]
MRLLALALLAAAVFVIHAHARPGRPRTVAEALARYGPAAKARFQPLLRSWPPKRLVFLAFKSEASLEAWAAGDSGPFQKLAAYPILRQSGGLGPKLKEGDLQVPEGFYGLPVLNPLSQFHLSIRVGYPNEEDIRHSQVPRGEMGGDIYIHGSDVSIGCLAMGDPAIEELFALAAAVPKEQRRVIISPVDFRRGARTPEARQPWLKDLYRRLGDELKKFPAS